MTSENSGTVESALELVLDDTQLADLELILNGAYAPLTGFMTARECESVVQNGTLVSGEAWSVPIVLRVSDKLAESLMPDSTLELVHPESVRLAELKNIAVWESSGKSIADGKYVSGELKALADSVHYDFNEIRLSPEQYRDANAGSSSDYVVGFASDAAITGGEIEALVSNAREHGGRILLAPTVSPDLGWGRSQFDLVRSYMAVLPRFEEVPVDVVLTPSPHKGDAGLRKTVLQNFGCQQVLWRTDDGNVESDPLPEVVEIMERSMPTSAMRGFTVFFTGLPSSGKSTLANHLVGKLMEEGSRSVTLLDGDIVRRHLSSELGFSREDRDTNIRRIGFVASEITKAGGVAVCAPIAPYDAVRLEVRDLVAEYGDFIEVYVSTPVEVCEQRDRKGLYAKARQGLLTGFTGVDDPYEIPHQAELEIDTSDLSTDESMRRVIDLLSELGLIEAFH